MQRGEIWLAELPPPSGVAGHEQHGNRPVVVMQHSGTTPNLPTVLIVPITKNQRTVFPGSFTVQPSVMNALDLPSTVLTHQLRAIDKARLKRSIGRLESIHLQKLETEIRALLNL